MNYRDMLNLRGASLRLAHAVQSQAQVTVSIDDMPDGVLQAAVDDMEAALAVVGGTLPDDFIARLASITGATLVGCALPDGEYGSVQTALDGVPTLVDGKVAAAIAAVVAELQAIVDSAVAAYEQAMPLRPVSRYPGADLPAKYAAAVASGDMATLDGGDYPALPSTSDRVFSLDRVAPAVASPKPVVDIVHNAGAVEDLSYITGNGVRWDLLCGFQTTDVGHHPYNSGVFVDDDSNYLYITYKEDIANGVPNYIEKRTLSGAFVSGTTLPTGMGSLETFRVDGGKLRTGGPLLDPSFVEHDIVTGERTKKYTYSGVVFTSRQFASVDPMDPDRLIVLARQSGIGWGLFEFRFSKATSGDVLPLQARISIPYTENESPGIQGFVQVGEKSFLLTGDGSTATSKWLWEFRTWDGKLVSKNLWRPNGTYGAGQYGTSTVNNSAYEPEGLSATILKRGGHQTFTLYSGMMTSNAVPTRRCLIWRGIQGIADTVPVIQGVPRRNSNTDVVMGKTATYALQFLKSSGGWIMTEENFRPLTSKGQIELVQVETGLAGYTQPVLCFYLYCPFIGILNVHTTLGKQARSVGIDAVYELDGTGAGGGTSTKQIVMFVDTKDGGYVDATTVPVGTRLYVNLTVITG